MSLLEKFLRKIAGLQIRFTVLILIALLLITVAVGSGLGKVRMEGDINKQYPQHLPVFELNDRISAKLGGQDTSLILIELSQNNFYEDSPKDIREAEVIKYVSELENKLKRERVVDGVTSVASQLRGMQKEDSARLEMVVKNSPELDMFFSPDYTKTVMFVRSDVGTSEKKVRQLTELINEKVNSTTTPAGVNTIVTGMPQMQVKLIELLKSDAVYTIVLASVIIIFLLSLMRVSVTKALLIFIPLMVGLTWTLGTMGWLGVKLSVATVGIGAMILGLGVEYGVFMLERYEEEREKNNTMPESLKIAVSKIGSAISGSGLTTMSGFLALTLSILPLLQNLGFTLALGIFYCLLAAIIVMPPVILVEERLVHYFTHKNHAKLAKRKEKLSKYK